MLAPVAKRPKTSQGLLTNRRAHQKCEGTNINSVVQNMQCLRCQGFKPAIALSQGCTKKNKVLKQRPACPACGLPATSSAAKTLPIPLHEVQAPCLRRLSTPRAAENNYSLSEEARPGKAPHAASLQGDRVGCLKHTRYLDHYLPKAQQPASCAQRQLPTAFSQC